MMDIKNIDSRIVKWIEVLRSTQAIPHSMITELTDDLVAIHQRNQKNQM